MTSIIRAEKAPYETWDDPEQNIRDFNTAKWVTEVLLKYYPEHLWAVNVSGGVATVRNLRLSGRWGFLLKLNELSADAKVAEAQIMRAGGELLERYYQPRAGMQIKYMNDDLVPDHG